MFLRIKNQPSNNAKIRKPYLYLCESKWDKEKKHPVQKVVKYLGRVKNIGTLDITKIKFDKCIFCKTTKNLTIDHIIPLSRGGTNALKNIQILCKTCNEKKGDKVI